MPRATLCSAKAAHAGKGQQGNASRTRPPPSSDDRPGRQGVPHHAAHHPASYAPPLTGAVISGDQGCRMGMDGGMTHSAHNSGRGTDGIRRSPCQRHRNAETPDQQPADDKPGSAAPVCPPAHDRLESLSG